MKNFTVVIEKDEDSGYIAYVPALQGCHTQGDTIDELMVRIKEAIVVCYDKQKDECSLNEFVGIQNVTVAV